MIEISVVRQDDGKVIGLSIEGHSGTAERGHDIVCAGVSALAQSVILSLANHLHRKITYDVNSKSGSLNVALTELPDELTEAVFSVALAGFAEIAKNYPRNVALEDIRR